jgi:hypothetical protein
MNPQSTSPRLTRSPAFKIQPDCRFDIIIHPGPPGPAHSTLRPTIWAATGYETVGSRSKFSDESRPRQSIRIVHDAFVATLGLNDLSKFSAALRNGFVGHF